MNDSTVKGMLLLLLCLAVSATSATICKPIPDGFDCKSLDLTSFDSANLPGSVENLDFSSNPIRKLDSNSLKRFSSLIVLKLKLTNLRSVSDDAFSNQSDLRILDIGQNSGLRKLNHLPSSLEDLDLSGDSGLFEKNDTVNWSDLDSLKVLKIRSADLKTFPNSLDKVGYTLEELDLKGNEGLNFGVADLAPLCHLTKLNVSHEEHDNFIEIEDTCQCKLVQKWITMTGISSSEIICAGEGTCSDDLSKYQKIREECINGGPSFLTSVKKTVKKYIFWGIIIVIIVILVSGFCFYVRQTNKKFALAADDENSVRGKLDAQSDEIISNV